MFTLSKLTVRFVHILDVMKLFHHRYQPTYLKNVNQNPFRIKEICEFKFIFNLGLTPLWQQTGCTAEIFISQSRAIFSPNCDSFQLATSTQVSPFCKSRNSTPPNFNAVKKRNTTISRLKICILTGSCIFQTFKIVFF